MKKQTNTDYIKYLPIYGALKDNKKVKWIAFGTFTSGIPRSPKTLIKIFKSIIHQVGLLNNSYERRLHYVARLEKHLSGDWHIHFLLGGHKIIDGNNSSITINQACKYLETLWNDYGISDVQEYDQNKSGLEYILKEKNANEHDDPTIVSSALLTMLKNGKIINDASVNKKTISRDPLVELVINQLNQKTKVAYFGDEITEARLQTREARNLLSFNRF